MAADLRSRIVVLRLAFCGAVLFAMVMASLPQPPQIPGQPSDKVQHIFAFAVLTLLAVLAYALRFHAQDSRNILHEGAR